MTPVRQGLPCALAPPQSASVRVHPGTAFLRLAVFVCVVLASIGATHAAAAKRADAARSQEIPASGTTKSARLQRLQAVVDSRGWLKDPFRHLQSDMVDVIEDLAEGETKFPAEVSEPKIISRLDTLIELLEKQCNGGRGGAGGRPLQRSVLAGGPGGQGALNAPRNSQRKWAELTAKERERILQSRTEGFPPGYEEILGEYFRRLAAEDSVRAVAPVSAPVGRKNVPDR